MVGTDVAGVQLKPKGRPRKSSETDELATSSETIDILHHADMDDDDDELDIISVSLPQQNAKTVSKKLFLTSSFT